MQNKSIGAFMLIALCALINVCTGCASKQKDEEVPLWASYDTIEAVYPNSTYIARIGYSGSAAGSAALAESELGSYFSHSVHSVVQGSQVMTDSGTRDASLSRKIERTVTVESLNKLFDVKKTAPWYNRQKKQYVCCAYLTRSDAWKLYEGTVRDAKNKFHTFYDKAAAESDPIRKLSLLALCDQSAADFVETLEMARLILPGKESAYAADRKIAEGLELEKEACRINSVFYVNVTGAGDEGVKLARCVSQIVSDAGFIVTSKRAEAVYEVLVELDMGKTVYGETLTAEPGISISIPNSGNKLSYHKNLPKQSGFTAAQALVERKIIAAAEDEIKASFPLEFNKL
jgi:hypothetical protein